MKKVFALLLVVLMVFTMAACDTTEETPQETTPVSEPIVYEQRNYVLKDVADRLKFLGRASVAGNGVACDLTASGIEFDAFMQDQFSFTVSCSEVTYFTVFVDGVRQEKRYEAKGDFQKTTIVVDGLGEMALRNIRIVKQTEAKLSVATLTNLEFFGFLASKPKNQELYIEFIGDSISCGYGVLWTKNSGIASNKSGTAQFQDGTQSFAYLTAQLLKADVSIVSCSGIGIDKGYTNQDGTGYRMLDFYKADSYVRSKTEEFDFANARVPDVVVINLGTNDLAVGSTEGDFKAGVKDLVEFIRTSYGKNVPIVWVYGMMSDGCYQWAQSVLTQMGGEASGLYLFELIRNKEGGNGHPSLVAQDIASQQLTGFLTSKKIVEI